MKLMKTGLTQELCIQKALSDPEPSPPVLSLGVVV